MQVHRADLPLLATVVVWGLNFSVLKVVLETLDAHVLNGARFSVSALVLGGVFWLRHGRDATAVLRAVRPHVWRVAGLGVLGYFLFPVAFLLGVGATTAGNAALLMASAPLWTAAVGHVVGIETLGRRAWAGLAVAAAGTAVVVVATAPRVTLASDVLLGNGLMAAAAALWGTYTVLNRPVLDDVPPLPFTLCGLLAALPLLHAVALPGYAAAGPEAVTVTTVAGVAYAGALATGLAFVWWNSSVKAVGPSRTGVYGNLVPVVGLLGGAVALEEPVGVVQVLGAALIVGGVLVVRRTRPVVAECHDDARHV